MTKSTKSKSTSTESNEKKGRPVLNADTCSWPVDDEGLFTDIPVPEAGDLLSFAPLKKDAFANEATYLEYRADCADLRAERLVVQAEKLRESAELSRKYGDSKLRKKAKQLMAKREAIAKLEAELADAGIEI